jgi:hypothetical protein
VAPALVKAEVEAGAEATPDLYDKLTLELQRAIALMEGTLDELKDLQKALLHLDQNLCHISNRADRQTRT